MRLPLTTAWTAMLASCAADPVPLVAPDAGPCASMPSTDVFEVVDGGYQRVFPVVTDGCLHYQTTMFVAAEPSPELGFETHVCNACEAAVAIDVFYPGISSEPLEPPTISTQLVYSIGVPIGTRDPHGVTYLGAECGGRCTYGPVGSGDPGPIVPVRSLLAPGATEVLSQHARELDLSVTDQKLREPGGGWTLPDYSGELEGLLVYPRARSATSALSLDTASSLTVLCKSIGLANRDDLDGNQRYRRGELGKVEDLYIIRSIGPLRLPEKTMRFLRSLELRTCDN